MWWFNFDGGEGDNDEDAFSYVHPLERGAEGVYEYRSGDSATIHLPGGKEIVLHEVVVRAREASADLIVGSLWFEVGWSARSRRVSPRCPDGPDEVRRRGFVRGRPGANPCDADDAVHVQRRVVHDRLRTLWRALVAAPIARRRAANCTWGSCDRPPLIDQSFRYASVNGTDTLPTVTAGMRRFSTDLGDDIGSVVEGVVDGVVPGNQFKRRSRSARLRKGRHGLPSRAAW